MARKDLYADARAYRRRIQSQARKILEEDGQKSLGRRRISQDNRQVLEQQIPWLANGEKAHDALSQVKEILENCELWHGEIARLHGELMKVHSRIFASV